MITPEVRKLFQFEEKKNGTRLMRFSDIPEKGTVTHSWVDGELMKEMSVNFSNDGDLVDLSIATPAKLRAAFLSPRAEKQGFFARLCAWLGR